MFFISCLLLGVFARSFFVQGGAKIRGIATVIFITERCAWNALFRARCGQPSVDGPKFWRIKEVNQLKFEGCLNVSNGAQLCALWHRCLDLSCPRISHPVIEMNSIDSLINAQVAWMSLEFICYVGCPFIDLFVYCLNKWVLLSSLYCIKDWDVGNQANNIGTQILMQGTEVLGF